MIDQLDFIYAAGETKRFHTWPVLRERTVAHHSWHVAMLLHLLYGQEEPGLTPMLLMAALCHDAAEWKVGDLPSPGKRGMAEYFPDFREKWGEMEEAILSEVSLDWDKFLTDEERRRLKLCDSMEGALYCCNERAMGNKLIAEPYHNFLSYINEIVDLASPAEKAVWDYIHQVWEKSNAS